MNDLMLFERRGTVVVSSRVVAERFGKEHFNVLRDIRAHIEGITRIGEPPENDSANAINFDGVKKYFIASHYVDAKGETRDEFLVTRKGFTLLAMGFTGEAALVWKLKYIDAFDAMETILRERQSADWKQSRLDGKKQRLAETDVIQTQLIPLAESQGSKNAGKLYMTYSKLVNATLGIEAGQRDNLPLPYVDAIRFLEHLIENIISDECAKGTRYKEIYQVCKAKCLIAKELAFLPRLTA
jgi:Rha family phage regulatory protein